MKKLTIEINILGDEKIAPMENQDILFDQLKEKILDGCGQGEIYLLADNPDKDNIQAYWKLIIYE